MVLLALLVSELLHRLLLALVVGAATQPRGLRAIATLRRGRQGRVLATLVAPVSVVGHG